MATRFWTGQGIAKNQINNNTISASALGVVFTITIGGYSETFTAAGVSTAAAAAGLAGACRSSSHPYFKRMSWQAVGSVVQATAYEAGMKFIQTSTATAGGTITTSTVAGTMKGPNYFDDADNWDTKTLPVGGDDIIIADSDINICWGLDTFAAVTFNSFLQDRSYIGRIGLDYTVFATTANGIQFDKTKIEYRPCYLKFKIVNGGNVDLGKTTGTSSSVGSRRTMLDFNGSKPDVFLHGSNNSPADVGRPAVRLLSAAGAFNLYVYNATGGVGVGDEIPGETSSIGELVFMPASVNSWIVTGDYTTIATSEMRSGISTIKNTSGLVASVYSGTGRFMGKYRLTELLSFGGTSRIENEDATYEIGILRLAGGTIDATGRAKALKVGSLYVEEMQTPGRIVAPDNGFSVNAVTWNGKINLTNRSA